MSLTTSKSDARIEWPILIAAMLLPTGITYAHLILFAGRGEGNILQQIFYIAGTVVQYTFPILFVFIIDKQFPKPRRFSSRGLGLGISFGLIIGVGMIALYHLALKNTPIFSRTAEQLQTKLEEYGVASPLGFFTFAVLLSGVHSLLEEYYWRWFVFARLRRLIPLSPAIIVSGIAFSLHHIILLFVWFPGDVWLAVVPFSICTAIGGCAWAWIYEKSDSILPVWVSHALVDAAIFVVGYDLYFVR